MIKILRVMRLLKVVKVLHASAIIQRWENSISISYSSRSLGSSMVGILVMLHWLTCFWALLPQLQGDYRNATGLEPAVALCVEDPDSCIFTGWTDAAHGTCSGARLSEILPISSVPSSRT